jgi:hypothetical protein
MTQEELRHIWQKTEGHCHFCGDPVVFETRGWVEGDLTGYWEVDHVIQRQKGGSVKAGNCLPACTRCNRLRWHRKGEGIRELLFLGLIARDEIRSGGAVGRILVRLREQRIHKNEMRRKTGDRAAADQGIASSQSASLDRMTR